MFSQNKLRESFVNYLEEKCDKVPLSKNSVGQLLRAFHISCPVFLLLFVLIGSKWLKYFAIVFLIFVIISFIIFNGCFMTSLEYKLLEDKFNIADPFLEICNMEINNKNRYNITLCVGTIYTIIFLLIFYFVKQ